MSNDRPPRVFITNDPGSLDFRAAEQFGEVHRLTKGSVDPFRPHIAQQGIESQLNQLYDSSKDYILPAGAALSVGFAFSWLAMHGGDEDVQDAAPVKLLLFDSKKREYMVRVVDL